MPTRCLVQQRTRAVANASASARTVANAQAELVDAPLACQGLHTALRVDVALVALLGRLGQLRRRAVANARSSVRPCPPRRKRPSWVLVNAPLGWPVSSAIRCGVRLEIWLELEPGCRVWLSSRV